MFSSLLSNFRKFRRRDRAEFIDGAADELLGCSMLSGKQLEQVVVDRMRRDDDMSCDGFWRCQPVDAVDGLDELVVGER